MLDASVPSRIASTRTCRGVNGIPETTGPAPLHRHADRPGPRQRHGRHGCHHHLQDPHINVEDIDNVPQPAGHQVLHHHRGVQRDRRSRQPGARDRVHCPSGLVESCFRRRNPPMHSWTSHLRPLSAALVVLGVAGTAFAPDDLGDSGQDTAACCQLTTSLIQDVLRGKDVPRRRALLQRRGRPAQHPLPDRHLRLHEGAAADQQQQPHRVLHHHHQRVRQPAASTPSRWPTAGTRASPTRFRIPGTGLGSDTGFPLLFQDDKFYGYMYWADLSNPDPQWNTREEACQSQVPNWNGSSRGRLRPVPHVPEHQGLLQGAGPNGCHTAVTGPTPTSSSGAASSTSTRPSTSPPRGASSRSSRSCAACAPATATSPTAA